MTSDPDLTQIMQHFAL